MPPFEPISVPSNTGVGELTIQNAWSDGLYLHLELELAAEGIPFDTAYANSISPCDDPYVEGTDTSHLWVNNLEAEKIATIENGLGFVWTGESTDGGATPVYTGEWVYRLPQNAAQGPDLSVSLEVPFLYTCLLYTSWGVGAPSRLSASRYRQGACPRAGSLCSPWKKAVPTPWPRRAGSTAK